MGLVVVVYGRSLSEQRNGHVLVVLLQGLERLHLVVVGFLGEEHLLPLLVQLRPELLRLLDQLRVGRVVVLVVQLQRLHQVSLHQLCLVLDLRGDLGEDLAELDHSRVERVHALLVFVDEVFVELRNRFVHLACANLKGLLEGGEEGLEAFHLTCALLRRLRQHLQTVPQVSSV